MKAHQPDYFLITLVIALVIFGLVTLSSASVVLSQENFGESYFYLKHQILYGLSIGLILALLIQKIPYWYWQKISFPLLILTFVLLILVFVPGLGYEYGGAQRWISWGPISFQSAELAKLSLIIYLSAWLAKKKDQVRHVFQGLIPFLIISLVFGFLIALQPDIGTLGIIILIGTVIYFLAGARISHLLLVGGLSLGALFVLIKIAPYRLSRLIVYLHPEIDPQGIGYQINQALLAIGSGGLFGLGLGHSIQKWKYLPQPINDSIFAIIAEEIGFIGVTILIILFLLLALRGFKIAKNAPDGFSRLMAAGITFWLVIQAFVNMAAISALIPLTGLPLPFISYGGSALAISLIGIGILVNISKYTR